VSQLVSKPPRCIDALAVRPEGSYGLAGGLAGWLVG